MHASERRLLDAEPPLQTVDRICLACWHTLHSCRPSEQHTIAQGVVVSTRAEIPWTAIVEWGRSEGLGHDELRVLAAVIHILDVERTEQIYSELRSKAT